MFRKLFVAAALVLATATAVTAPAPAIDFICTCQSCAGGSGPSACRDLYTGRFMSCSTWWATYSNRC